MDIFLATWLNSKQHIKRSNNRGSKTKRRSKSRSTVLASGSCGRSLATGRRRTRRRSGAGRSTGLGDVEVLRLRNDAGVGGGGANEADLILGAGGDDDVGEGVLVVGCVNQVLDGGLLWARGGRVVDQHDGEVGGVSRYGCPRDCVGLGEVPGGVGRGSGDSDGLSGCQKANGDEGLGEHFGGFYCFSTFRI